MPVENSIATLLGALTSIEAVFHFGRIVAKRSVVHRFENTQVYVLLRTIEYDSFRYDTVDLENGLTAHICVTNFSLQIRLFQLRMSF